MGGILGLAGLLVGRSAGQSSNLLLDCQFGNFGGAFLTAVGCVP